jgi:uncharacterized alkaline shock family protein YloU
MTSPTTVAVPGGRPEPRTTPAEERGTTEISERVVQRIAAKVVNDAEHAGGAARRMLGISLGSDSADTAPQVSARVDGQIAAVEVTMSVAWPQPVRDVTRRVRNDIISSVGELTGLTVRHVDIAITSLLTDGNGRTAQ